MIFSATNQQVLAIAANAVNASKPMGMGFLHFRETTYTASEMQEYLRDRGLYIDYHDGRMVKLVIHRKEREQWEINDNISADYESWIASYPTVQALVNSVLLAAA